ncbi:type VII secretion target [Amycolatopsis anabasis]|uniref:type VII secretion target n=1 Tax=Amycolatopsis anabasis TaxID=1840409 RepID=UPI00131C3456|nr:type VII secretion target [Amycolatopsis anabasis]
MTEQNQFHVEPGEIRAHAGTVGDVAGGLSSLAGGLQGGLPEAALGTFVQFLAVGLQDAMNQTSESVKHASSAVDGLSTRLTQVADRYESTDSDGAARLPEEIA